MNSQNQPNTNIVGQIRALLPHRPLHVYEAMRVAELQACQLRSLLGDASPNFDTDQLGELPRIDVQLDAELQASGSTQWDRGAWRIRLNGGEALVRQRFTLAHEFKHILDAPGLDTSYASIQERIDGERQIEAVCDYFAACLLMPKRWVKRLWGEGVRDLNSLADTFDVSPAAMKRRLEDIGLIDRRARSLESSAAPAWTRTTRRRFGRAFYRRGSLSIDPDLVLEVA